IPDYVVARGKTRPPEPNGAGARPGPRSLSARPKEGVMAVDRPQRRMTLRQLLTHSEKCSRDLAEQLHSTLLPRNTDCRELSRPTRRRSHYPTALALLNALQKLIQADQEAQTLADYLHQQLEEIRDHAKREKLNRR